MAPWESIAPHKNTLDMFHIVCRTRLKNGSHMDVEPNLDLRP